MTPILQLQNDIKAIEATVNSDMDYEELYSKLSVAYFKAKDLIELLQGKVTATDDLVPVVEDLTSRLALCESNKASLQTQLEKTNAVIKAYETTCQEIKSLLDT